MTLLIAKIVVALLIVAVTVSRLLFANRRSKEDQLREMPARELSPRASVLAVVGLVVAGIVLFALR